MNILRFIDRFSFKQLLSASIFLVILLSIPLGVWLVNQQTKLSSRATVEEAFDVITPQPTFGPQPNSQPVIQGVKPFLGKEGDAVVISGENLGNNPRQREIWFGNQAASAKEILSWQDKEIQVLIPAGATFGPIRLEVEPFQVTWPKILTIYDRSTRTQIFYRGANLAVKNVANLKKVAIWGLGAKSEEPKEVILETPITVGEAGLDLALAGPPAGEAGKISWVTLFDQNDQPISFFVNPAEFGF